MDHPDKFGLTETSLSFSLRDSGLENKEAQSYVQAASKNVAGRSEARILIVEDELLVAENIKEILQKSGYTVVGVLSSGEEVMEQFGSLDPDLVLMDIRLSGELDGVQTALGIQNTLKQVPILFITAYSENQFPHLSRLQPTRFRCLAKPYHATQITEAVAELLNPSDEV